LRTRDGLGLALRHAMERPGSGRPGGLPAPSNGEIRTARRVVRIPGRLVAVIDGVADSCAKRDGETVSILRAPRRDKAYR